MSKKYTIEEVRKIFKDKGCELLEENYKNSRFLMKYRCICGHLGEIRLYSFIGGSRCQKCKGKKLSDEKRLTYEYVYDYFKDKGCDLLEKDYQNNRIKMKYKCSCGEISKITFSCFQQGNRCLECGGTKRNTYECVYNYFKDEGCELLEKNYQNNIIKMKYKCICGETSKISFSNFQKGQKCNECKIKKISGKNSCNYNPNLTDEERADRRKNPEYKQWTKNVYKKDGYTCKKCLKVGYKLNAHHIEGFAENKKLRVDINNGITFCKDCHDLFHAIYGKKNITKKQLDDFMIKKSMKRTG